ncbi:hypothetical protein M3215_04100 [Bacillus cytotoxicus]|uniref:Uncharacterized protein n=1 Tax=Bacillus cytotoxicus TaxID=580165 RepID=A0ACC6A2Y9_9BACI|nr:hypothetical protein [Bacillus cytotoxicus]
MKLSKKNTEIFWGYLAFSILTFIIYLIIDLKDTSLSTLGWRDWLGSAVGAATLSIGMFTLSKLD